MISTALRPATPDAISEAAQLILTGELVAFPTETVYGLGANALNRAAIYRIFAAKGRPSTDPLIIHVTGLSDLHQVVTDVPDIAKRLIEKFWPGPLTLILPRNPTIPDNVSGGLPTVAVRAPIHPVAQALIKAAGVPIAAPSANRFAHVSPTQAHHVYEDLNGRIPLILDGGSTDIGVESTIVDVSGNQPRLLRPGAIGLAALSVVVPNIEVSTRFVTISDGAQPASGQMKIHYAPSAALFLYEGTNESIRSAIRKAAIEHIRQGTQIGLLIADEDRAALSGIDVPCVSLGSLYQLDHIAQQLYSGLRDLDALAVKVILARSYPTDGIGLAIRDRLIRAAAGRVIAC